MGPGQMIDYNLFHHLFYQKELIELETRSRKNILISDELNVVRFFIKIVYLPLLTPIIPFPNVIKSAKSKLMHDINCIIDTTTLRQSISF